MDTATLLVDVLIALWFLAVLIGIVRAWKARLIPLTKQARARYVMAWDRIESRFLYAPEEAVREADGLVLSVLRDRHHATDYAALPRRAKQARRKLSMDEGRGMTELLRQAMLDYRSVLDEMVGYRHRVAVRQGRRQVA
jgi:hypothetical protein